MPEREELFEFNAPTGAPLTRRERLGHPPGQEGTVRVLIYGAEAIIDLDLVVRSKALAPLDAPYHRTGDHLAGYELLHIPDGLRTAPDAILPEDVFARFDEAGGVEAVMMCSRPGTVPSPQCGVHFKTDILDVQVGSIRRDELHHLDEIMTTARGFVSCLVR